MKGLGKEITKPLISNEDIDKQLNLLEITRQKTDLGNPDSVKTLSQKIEVGIDKLIHKDFDTEEEIEQQDAVLTILNEEKRKYIKNKSNNTGESGNKDAYIPKPYVTDPETGDVSGGMARYDVTPEKVAEAFMFMDSDLHWDSYRSTQWFKDLGATKEGERQQARIEYMVMVNNGASWVSRFGPNLEKITSNPMYFALDNEKFTKLFDEDFKLVMSKMLNDLCEKYTDQNGKTCIRYKEVPDTKNGGFKIDDKVSKHLKEIRDYKEEMADFLAKQNNRTKPNYIDRMNASTAWNLFYMFGDSSLADRMRVLPTYGGIINDGLRTLNPEYKALKKWRISQGEKPFDTLFGAEWFGGPLATYVQTVMKVEEDLERPINGSETMRERMVKGELPVLANKTFYGFFDFTSGGRDLFDKNGDHFYDEKKGKLRDETLSTLLLDYASFNGNGELIEKNGKDFNFGHNQVDFLNEYRDQQEAAVLVFNCITGKEEIRDVDAFVRKIRSAFGMVDDIKINGKKRNYSYTTRPDLWANMILGSFGVDMSRLSNNHIRLKTKPIKTTDGRVVNPAYNLYLSDFLTSTLKLSNNDVNLNEIMRYMGVNLNPGENPRSTKVTVRSEFDMAEEKMNTSIILGRQVKNFQYDNQNNLEVNTIKNEFQKIKITDIRNNDSRRIYNDLERAIRSNNGDVAGRLLKAFIEKNKSSQ